MYTQKQKGMGITITKTLVHVCSKTKLSNDI
jgi:hypothetical protein